MYKGTDMPMYKALDPDPTWIRFQETFRRAVSSYNRPCA